MPRSASEQRIAGWALVGAGVLHLVLMPVCFSHLPPRGAKGVCAVSSIALGVTGIAAGIWFLSHGYSARTGRRRADLYERGWARHASRLQLAIHGDAGMLQYRSAW